MLKKVGFGLLMLILVSFATGQFLEKFERPWDYEYKWPGNPGVIDYTYSPPLAPGWNARITQQGLDYLNLGDVPYPYSENKHVAAAKGNYSKAEFAYEQIDEFANYGILPYVFNIEDACKQLDVQNCSCVAAGKMLNCNIAVEKEIRYVLATRWLSPSYSAAWKGTMNNALDALEESAKALNKELRGLEAAYAEAGYSGVCNTDVAGYGVCENVSIFLAVIEGNSTAGEHPDFAKIRQALANNTKRVDDDVPLLEFYWVVNSIGDGNNGAVAKVKRLNAGLEGHFNKTKTNYLVLADETGQILEEAQALKRSADGEELWRIRAGPYFEEIIGDNVAGVGENANRGSGHLKAAYANMTAARFAYAYGNKGYLRDALVKTTNAKALALEAMREFQTAIVDAENVVSDYETKAADWLTKAGDKFANGVWPARARALYENAGGNFENGQNEQKLGLEFEDYASAIKDAREAYSISLEGERDTNWSAISACAEATNIVKKAQQDDVDVFAEDAMLSVLSKGNDAGALIAGCNGIIESAVGAAEYKYFYLDGLRAEVAGLLDVCGSDCDDLAAVLEKNGIGLVSGGRVIYPDAISSLKNLAQLYARVKADAEKSIKQQIGAYLLVRKNLFAENAVLDGQSAARLEIELINTVNYPGENVRVEVESAVPFDEEDIVHGEDNLNGAGYVDGKLLLYVKKIGASARELFVFERNQTLLKTTGLSRGATGREDYSALVIEKMDIFCEAEVIGFYVSDEWDALVVDGVPVVVESGFVRKQLSGGSHEFEADYAVAGAYSKTIGWNSSTKIGERVYHKYQVQIIPNMDMGYIETFAVVPAGAYVSGRNVITATGEKIESAETSDGFVVRVFGLKQGRTAKFEVSYYVDNSSEYARAQIKEIGALNVSNETREILGEAGKALEDNDTARAVGKIQDAREQIERERIDAAKLNSEYMKYYEPVIAELEKLSGVMIGGASQNNAFSEKMLSRKNFLESVVDSLEDKDLETQVSILKEYDKTWLPEQLRAFKKNASVEMNRAYVRYLGIGVDDELLASDFSDLRALYNKFDASSSLEDAYALADALGETAGKMALLEKRIKDENSVLAATVTSLRDEIVAIMKEYGDEYGDAKGSRFESIFKIKPEDAEEIMKRVDAGLKKGNVSAITGLYEDAVGIKINLNATLNYLEGSANGNAEQTKNAIALASGKLSEKDAKRIGSLASSADGYLAGKEWVKALKTDDEILKILAPLETKQDYGIILWLSVVFVLGVVALYYFKGRKVEPRKILRKLEKVV